MSSQGSLVKLHFLARLRQSLNVWLALLVYLATGATAAGNTGAFQSIGPGQSVTSVM